MPISLEDLKNNLSEARTAHHSLQIGEAVAEFQDSNGERVRYTQANKSHLKAYIADLENQIANYGKPSVSGPMRVLF